LAQKISFAVTSLLVLRDSLSHQPFEISEALLDLRFLEHSEVQVHQRGQARGDPVAQATAEGVTCLSSILSSRSIPDPYGSV